MSWESECGATCRQWGTPSLGVNSCSSLEFICKARTTGRGLAAWSAAVYKCSVLSRRHLALQLSERPEQSSLLSLRSWPAEKWVEVRLSFLSFLSFLSMAQMWALLSRVPDIKISDFSFRSTNYVSYFLGDNQTSRISAREDPAVAK